MNIAKIIREGREKLDLNQSQLAKLVGVSPQAVQQWEAGVTQPRGKRLNKIAQVLKLPPSLLHFGMLPEKPEAAGTIQEPAGITPATPASLKPAKKNPGEPPESAAESPGSSKDALIKEVINAMQRMSKEDAARLVKISNALVGASGEESKEAEEIDLKPLPKADLAPHPPPAFPPRRVSTTSAKTRGKTAIR
jgi:HTH-type transcriptional regulator, cell division transcriptional repressor